MRQKQTIFTQSAVIDTHVSAIYKRSEIRQKYPPNALWTETRGGYVVTDHGVVAIDFSFRDHAEKRAKVAMTFVRDGVSYDRRIEARRTRPYSDIGLSRLANQFANETVEING